MSGEKVMMSTAKFKNIGIKFKKFLPLGQVITVFSVNSIFVNYYHPAFTWTP